jgi:hypothetical protein
MKWLLDNDLQLVLELGVDIIALLLNVTIIAWCLDIINLNVDIAVFLIVCLITRFLNLNHVILTIGTIALTLNIAFFALSLDVGPIAWSLDIAIIPWLNNNPIALRGLDLNVLFLWLRFFHSKGPLTTFLLEAKPSYCLGWTLALCSHCFFVEASIFSSFSSTFLPVVWLFLLLFLHPDFYMWAYGFVHWSNMNMI